MNDVPRGLLRETLRGRLTPPPASGCIDSAVLAAWSEGTLPARDREAIERHASECERCQALLAAMVRTAPAVSPARWWRPSTFAWLAPIAAAVAAILVWINVPGPTVKQSPAIARMAPEPVPPAVTAPASPGPKPDAPPLATERPAAARALTRAKSAATRPRSAASPPAALADAADAAIAQKKEAPQPAEPATATKSAPPEPRDTLSVAPVPPAAAPVGARPEPAPSAGAGGGMLRSKLDATAPLDKVMAAGLLDIASPDASVRWRIFPPPGGRVARSTDGGATWQMQSANVNVALNAGAAPAPTVCWLVGAGGTVLLSTDGRTWQRVAFPESIDLVAVRATDAATATVTAAGGRTFSTTDGGKSWRQP